MDEILNKDFKMKINVWKTKVLLCEKESKTRVHIQLIGSQIYQVDEFKYLGSV